MRKITKKNKTVKKALISKKNEKNFIINEEPYRIKSIEEIEAFESGRYYTSIK